MAEPVTETLTVVGLGEVALAVLLVLAATSGKGGIEIALEKTKEARDARNKVKDLTTAGAAIGVIALCAQCPPATGMPVQAPFAMSVEAAKYQARAAWIPPEMVLVGMEWLYGSMYFDGFAHCPPKYPCTLFEAKAGYKQFLDKKKFKEWAPWFTDGAAALVKQAQDQARIVIANPPAQLVWRFQEVEVANLMRGVLGTLAPTVTCEHFP